MIGVFVGEMIAAADGLGHMMAVGYRTLDTPAMYVAITTTSLLGYLLDRSFLLARRRLLLGLGHLRSGGVDDQLKAVGHGQVPLPDQPGDVVRDRLHVRAVVAVQPVERGLVERLLMAGDEAEPTGRRWSRTMCSSGRRRTASEARP